MDAHTRDRLITERTAAERLALAEQTLRNWRCTGRVRLPFVRVGGRQIRYRESVIEHAIEHGIPPAGAEPEAKQ